MTGIHSFYDALVPLDWAWVVGVASVGAGGAGEGLAEPGGVNCLCLLWDFSAGAPPQMRGSGY